jgi:hypothetical protein
MLFSECPFSDNENWYTFVRPSVALTYAGGKETKEVVIKRSDYSNIKDATVEITESRQGLAPKKIATFTWNNSSVKVKVNENTGTLQVFVDKKKRAGAYVKVFSRQGCVDSFYRDGYTDMTGTFRFAMADLDNITEFSILVSTDRGCVQLKAKPPSKLASY